MRLQQDYEEYTGEKKKGDSKLATHVTDRDYIQPEDLHSTGQNKLPTELILKTVNI